MFPAFPIGRVFGVQIRVHLLFVVLIALLVFGDWPGLALDRTNRLILLGILWASVLCHELGHSLVAKRFKVQVLDITFWPLGGMARFVNFPTDPGIELPIAIAGPAVNFAISMALLPWTGIDKDWVKNAWEINLALGVFNLIPAFPMDGGRVFRALLAFRLGFLRGTEIAVRIARWLAFGALVVAFVRPELFWMLILISVFVWLSATQELWSVRLRHASRTGNPFVFWKSFNIGNAPGEKTPDKVITLTPEKKSDDPKETQKDLESFKGSLREYFDGDAKKKENDPDGS